MYKVITHICTYNVCGHGHALRPVTWTKSCW